MRKILPSLPLLLLLQIIGFAQNSCFNFEYRQQLIQKYPELISSLSATESFTQHFIAGKKYSNLGMGDASNGSSVIIIPVVVHVLYNTTQQNISDAQVRSQIDVLNKDYRRLNADTINTPGEFQPFASDCGFQFQLAKVDPEGYATSGIIHKKTPVQSFGLEDAIKFSAMGGDDAWDRDQYLNIWVGNLSGGMLGYSSVVCGPKQNDGVVILYNAFGVDGSAIAPYNKGRTATHEIGHWLNLIHTWGDSDCGDDLVADTPPQQTADRGCPGGTIISCNNAPLGNMYQNYMDFTNDACMNLFTYGQRDRMLALFQPGGVRYPLLSSGALATPTLYKMNTDSSDNPASLISIYPNPAADHVNVQLSSTIAMGTLLEIYNPFGQKVSSLIITQPQFQLNISSLPRGIYFIKFFNGSEKNVVKFMKL